MGLTFSASADFTQGSLNARHSWLKRNIATPMDPAIARLRTDRVAFATQAGMVPDPWQADLLNSNADRILLNCSRQVGKTAVIALLGLHQALFEPGSLVVIVAVAQRQAMEMIRSCRDFFAALGRPIRAESENKLSLELGNGSRILSIPSTEATIRGLSKVRLLVLDEASRIPDALYAAVLPFLAISHGKLALLSTPFGRRGFFFDSYEHRAEWFYREVPAVECARISPEFLAEQRRKTGEYFYAQEWECQFNDSVTGAFRSDDIDRAVRDYETWSLVQYDVNQDGVDDAAMQEYTTWNLARYAQR
jgi:hypothetical protein